MGNIFVQLKGSGGGGGGSTTPAAPLLSLQFNNAGAFGGNRGILYDPSLFVSHGTLLVQDAIGIGNRSFQMAFAETGGPFSAGYGFIQAYNFDSATYEDFVVDGNHLQDIYHDTYQLSNGVSADELILADINDNLTLGNPIVTIILNADLGQIILSTLPNSDPGVAGALYKDGVTGAVFQSP